jgi:hypothetical protein
VTIVIHDGSRKVGAMGWFISRSKYLLGGWLTTGLAGDVFHGYLASAPSYLGLRLNCFALARFTLG